MLSYYYLHTNILAYLLGYLESILFFIHTSPLAQLVRVQLLCDCKTYGTLYNVIGH